MTKNLLVVEKILSANDRIASENRNIFDAEGIKTFNIMASPGAGKTSLIEQTIKHLLPKMRLAVIDGDIATSIDADRAQAAGALAVQINTGGECHLDAVMINSALKQMNLTNIDAIIIENVGNLVCPASFQLGSHKSILIASVPEGDDKPYKYPGTYESMDVILLNKIDLLPYVPFRMDYFERGSRALNSAANFIPISCTTGAGMDVWTGWILDEIQNFRASIAQQPHI